MHDETPRSENGPAGAWAVLMAVAAGLVRLLPHPANFTPVAALGLFGGARLRPGWAAVLPLGVMAVSDLLLRAIHGPGYTPFNPWVYGCFLLTVLWGRLLLRRAGPGRVVAVSLLASVQFFLVTNFGVWLADVRGGPPLPEGAAVVWKEVPGLPAPVPEHYAADPSGLLACYAAALPFAGSNAPPLGFLGNQLAGDLFYTGLLFGLYAWLCGGVRLRQPAAARVP